MKIDNKFYLFKYIDSKDKIKQIGKGKTLSALKIDIIGKRTRPNYEILLLTLTKDKNYKAKTINNTIGPIKINFQLFDFHNNKFESKEQTDKADFLTKNEVKNIDNSVKDKAHIFIKYLKII